MSILFYQNAKVKKSSRQSIHWNLFYAGLRIDCAELRRRCTKLHEAASNSIQQPPAADSPPAAPDTFLSDGAERHISALTRS